jgi:hypothetical protein
MGAPSRRSDGETATPPVGSMLLRGLGWGAASGFVCGFFLLGLAAGLSQPDLGVLFLVFPVGVASACVGALYGMVAGAAVACCIALVARWRHVRVASRPIGAIVGTLVVLGLSAALFDPSFAPRANETEEHVQENIRLYYVLPGLMAAAAGATLTPKLLLGRRRG